jgi:hypothetical protein
MSRVMKIALVAGQECLLSCHGVVRLQLKDGVVEVAGVLLQADAETVLSLSATSNRRISAYSFEGGTFTVTSSAAIDLVKSSTEAGALMAFVRSALLPQQGQVRTSRVAVVGLAGTGKTLTAHTICNRLVRPVAAGGGGGAAANAAGRVFLVDLSPASNSVLCPGCISAVHVSPSHPLLAGDAAAPEELGLAFFTGALAPIASVPLLVHQILQLQESLQSLIKQLVGARESLHVVYDVAAPDGDVPIDTFLRRVLEAIRPTHVVVVTNKKAEAADAGKGLTPWHTGLQEDVQRLLSDCEFRVLHHVPHRIVAASGPSGGGSGGHSLPAHAGSEAAAAAASSASSSLLVQQLLVDEYFAGTVERPLGSTKVVLKLSSLRFFTLLPPATAAPGDPPRVERITPTNDDIALTVCAVSYAAVEAELPFANIFGLMFVVSVDQRQDELVVVLPTGECEVPKPLILVPTGRKLKLTPAIAASYS